MKKYEREIRELLDKMDTFVPENPTPEKERNREREPEREPRKRPVGVMPPQPIPIRSKRPAPTGFRQWLLDHKIGPSMQMILGGLLLVVLALIVWQQTHIDWLAQLLGTLGGLVFLGPVLVRFFGGKYMDEDGQYWRGQQVGEGGFNWAMMRGWFGKKRRPKNPTRSTKDPWNNNKRW